MEAKPSILAGSVGYHGTATRIRKIQVYSSNRRSILKVVRGDTLQNQESKTVAKAMDDNWVSRFGCPANLHSDKGSNFMSNFFKNLCSLMGIDRTSATSYHPQKNAMIERTNRTIEETLSK